MLNGQFSSSILSNRTEPPAIAGVTKENKLAGVVGGWETAHMTTLVTADAKGRIPIRGSQPGQKYLVSQTGSEWRVTPFAKKNFPSRNRKERTPPKGKGKGKLSQHLKAMWDLGLRLETSESGQAPVPPCRF
jgi:hypothetical protein